MIFYSGEITWANFPCKINHFRIEFLTGDSVVFPFPTELVKSSISSTNSKGGSRVDATGTRPCLKSLFLTAYYKQEAHGATSLT